ncbi:hypothetical protein [Erythrobacter mangrovi]|uniref:DUF3617 family protein n=1 Tax=Erythrobacter mangrovi TaxID=2739433 RepID=A0A7D4B9P0_9SPHN|nr:hypothetical protein [Erythrobacter mangrovi]QKG71041.1 hypothetical protein HQR01_06440 [Erythrobacter mangrovi]
MSRKGMLMVLATPLLALAVPVLAQASLAMLDSLDKGGWELRYRDGTAMRKVCVKTGREFIQLRHTDSGCNRFVVEDGTNEVTVQYTCRGNGYGRTNIRKESGILVQIDSQGIADGKPFQFSAEGRRSGSCS